MATEKVSRVLLKRLPHYLNYLKKLPEDTENISATKMAKALELGDVLVRKDLAKVSSGGRRKLGYVRNDLIADIEQYMDINSSTDAIVVGAGKLGQALLDYSGFEASGLHIVAGFDIAVPKKCSVGGKKLFLMEKLSSFCKENQIAIAIITVPAESAQSVCDTLVDCGIRAIWNFAPVHLNVPDHIVVQTENLAVSLTALRMQMKNRLRGTEFSSIVPITKENN